MNRFVTSIPTQAATAVTQDMLPVTTASSYADSSGTEGFVTSIPTQAATAVTQVLTTVAPGTTDSAVIAVVIVLILVTIVVLGILLYRYLCQNKGAYRTTGERAPGEDPDEEYSSQVTSEKKEYFI